MQHTEQSGGTKHDQDKPPVALIPPKALIAEARVWGFGEKKYGRFQWKQGLSQIRILSALLRHTLAIMSGEDYDKESGCLHAAHIRCCAAMLIEFQGRDELDDRE